MQSLYVNDNLITGKTEAIDKAVKQLKKPKVSESLKNYLSCEILFSRHKKAWLEQIFLIKSLEESLASK